MSADYLLQPLEPRSEREEQMWCGKCEADTWQHITAWTRATAEATCTECGNVTELEPDDE